MALTLVMIVGILSGLSAWMIDVSKSDNSNIGAVIFSLMIFFLLAMIFSSYLILELVRLATKVTWTLVDRSIESPKLMQFEYLNMFIEEGIIESTTAIVPIT